MNLTEPAFLAFLVLQVPLYVVLGRWRGHTPYTVLLLMSLAFYATWNPLYLAPLLVTITTDYWVCRRIEASPRHRKAWLALSVTVGLGLLACFKYWDQLIALWTALPRLGHLRPPFRVVFMTGISFYTFQSLSCVIDVYRGDQKAVRSWVQYAAFVSFFPTLLAGPITRAATLLPQFARIPRTMEPDFAGRGFFLIALGFAKKVLIADVLGDALVNRVFEQPLFFSSLEVLAGIYAYAAQIYADFSGYSDIAIGAALLLGFQLKDNFNAPYRSATLGEFWQRWHISFSTWLRDYVFFALPGNRRGKLAPFVNIFLTFLLGGIWHGASACFVIWGAIHGSGLALERWLESRRRGPRRPPKGWRKVLGIAVTFHVVLLAWVFFRAGELRIVGEMAARLSELTLGAGNIPLWGPLVVLGGIGLQWVPEEWYAQVRDRFVRLPGVAQAGLLLAAALLVKLAGKAQVAPFIYQGF